MNREDTNETARNQCNLIAFVSSFNTGVIIYFSLKKSVNAIYSTLTASPKFCSKKKNSKFCSMFLEIK